MQMLERSLPEKFLFRTSRGMHVSGVMPGRFIRLHQGDSRRDSLVFHGSSWDLGSFEKHFFDFDKEPECVFGSAVYLVRKDGTLLELKANWDSSD
jgi:hypothetical protein